MDIDVLDRLDEQANQSGSDGCEITMSIPEISPNPANPPQIFRPPLKNSLRPFATFASLR